MDPQTPRQRLGSLVKMERTARGLGKEEAARRAHIDSITWGRIEAGKGVRDTSYAAIEPVLGWARGSCNLILGGGDPRLDEPAISEARLEAAEQRPPADFDLARKRLNAARIAIDQAIAVLDQIEERG